MCFPICWGIGEGGNVISPDSSFIFYGVLDCCLIPLTSAFFLASHWRIDPTRLGLRARGYDDPLPSRLGEKGVPANDYGVATNGRGNAISGQNFAAQEDLNGGLLRQDAPDAPQPV
jgi:hypothetical protein